MLACAARRDLAVRGAPTLPPESPTATFEARGHCKTELSRRRERRVTRAVTVVRDGDRGARQAAQQRRRRIEGS